MCLFLSPSLDSPPHSLSHSLTYSLPLSRSPSSLSLPLSLFLSLSLSLSQSLIRYTDFFFQWTSFSADSALSCLSSLHARFPTILFLIKHSCHINSHEYLLLGVQRKRKNEQICAKYELRRRDGSTVIEPGDRGEKRDTEKTFNLNPPRPSVSAIFSLK